MVKNAKIAFVMSFHNLFLLLLLYAPTCFLYNNMKILDYVLYRVFFHYKSIRALKMDYFSSAIYLFFYFFFL